MITLKGYYLPFGNSRKIPISKVRDVELVTQRLGEIWGYNDDGSWMPLDTDRIKRGSYISIDIGES